MGRKRNYDDAKYVVQVESLKGTERLRTISVYSRQKDRYLTEEEIKGRGIVDFGNLADVKETLNWNLYGDDSKYVFQWAGNSRTKSIGIAYIFD